MTNHFNHGTSMPYRVGEVLSIRSTRTSRGQRFAPARGPPVNWYVRPITMSAIEGWGLPVGLLCLGALLLGIAWLLLKEYRATFFANPRSIMSFDVLAEIVGAGG